MSFDRPRTNDAAQETPQQIAETLRRRYKGRWMIVWSDFEKQFLAYPTWIGGGGYTTKASSDVELEQRMTEIEQVSRSVRTEHASPFHQQPLRRQG